EVGGRRVVEDLRALVDLRGVVFAALDDDRAAATRRAEPERLLEAERDAADEEARVALRLQERPGDEARRRGLAVGAGDDDAVAVGQEQLAEALGEARVRPLALAQRRGLAVGLAMS